MPKIIVKYDPPPIPVRNCDWRAIDDSYDFGSPIGQGRTKFEAVQDLVLELWANGRLLDDELDAMLIHASMGAI